MNCEQVRALLGRFHDGELNVAERAAIEVHLGDCSGCPAQLAAIAELGDFARTLGQVEPPDLWKQLSHRLGEPRAARSTTVTRILPTWKTATVAALLLAAAVTGWLAYQLANPGAQEAAPAALTAEEQDPLLDTLLAAGAGERLSLQEVARHVDFRVLAAADLPDGCRLEECCLCQGGCCNLVQCKFLHRGQTVVLLQGSRAHPVRYGDRPVLETQVNGKAARVVKCNGCLACSWQGKETALTLFGPRDLTELVQLVAYVDRRLEENP